MTIGTETTRHLLGVGDLQEKDVERILDTARALSRTLDREVKKLPTLRGRLVLNLFYESSTRTLSSFELAAKRLSALLQQLMKEYEGRYGALSE